MPYLGNEPAAAFTSTTKDTFSGDASTTDFTMSKSANVNAVRVVVENVVQNPTVAYTCSGTTLSFTSAPPTGTNNIYVVHLGPPAATVAPPSTINNPTTFTGGVTLKNETPEDTDGGRESIVTFQGTQSGSEITTLAQIQASHDGTSDDQKGDLIFKTNDGSDGASPTTAMTIDSAQNVGIGTSSPSTQLHITPPNNTTANKITQSFGSARANGSDVIAGGFDSEFVTRDGNVNTGAFIRVIDTNTNGSFPTTIRGGVLSFGTVDGTTSSSADADEKMRIDSSGNVFINTLNDMGGILNTSHADGVAIGSANDQGYYRRIYGTSGANLELRFWNGSNEGSLNSSGAWVNASDVSLKENIADIEYGIDTVKSLKPRKYTMKEGGNSEVGFIAQEMESVVPEVVNTSENPNKDEIKGISYGQLTAVLTKALQEAIAKIETLETKVAALEGE